MAYTIIVAANASDPAPCKYILLSQVLLGEYFRDSGRPAFCL
jgi:F0F1-type ATP synthase alpha subunit